MKSKSFIIISILLTLLILVGGAYWYFIFQTPEKQVTVVPGNQTNTSGFVPIDRPINAQNTPDPIDNNTNNTVTNPTSSALAVLRRLSITPVGGFGIFTTTPTRSGQTGTTTMRWVDRGRGNTYEAYTDRPEIKLLSNTLIPRIYQSWWDRTLSVFFAQYMSTANDKVTTLVANIIKTSSTASAAAANNASSSASASEAQISETPFQLKGSLVSGEVIAVAVSPAKDKVLVVTKEKDHAYGYISQFDGKGQKQIFSLPLTQVTADWPETNTIAITTKASSEFAGYLYLINVKTGVMKQVLGGIYGLSAKVSKDASHIFYSSTGVRNTAIDTAVIDIKTGKRTEVIFKTLAEKCVWSPKFTENIYCAVPSQIADATYPDDWYIGNVSSNDNIWLLNTKTNEADQLGNLLKLGDALIDAYNPQIDEAETTLMFMNKNDLSLWSYDLISTR